MKCLKKINKEINHSVLPLSLVLLLGFSIGACAKKGTGLSGVAPPKDTYPNSGLVSLYSGLFPGSDGLGSYAGFNGPDGVAVDSSGAIYVSDTGDQTVRKITPQGAVTTLAGKSAAAGSADGPGASARFSNPKGLAVDSSFNVFVADGANCTIRKVTQAGVVSTFAGSVGNCASTDGTGVGAQFNSPLSMAIDSSNNLYVGDYSSGSIRLITPAGVTTTIASGIGAPSGIVVDSSSNVFVTSAFNHTVVKIAFPSRTVTTFAGSSNGYVDATGVSAKFYYPRGLGIDSLNNIYLVDSSNNMIRQITPGGVVTTLAGNITSGSGDGPGLSARFSRPFGVAVGPNSDIFVVELGNNTVRKIDTSPNHYVSTLAGSANNAVNGTTVQARFNSPDAIIADKNGNLYIAEFFNETIRKISTDGVVSTIAGTTGIVGSSDALGYQASFHDPAGLAFDAQGNLYVADSHNSAIRKLTFDAQGNATVSTLANNIRDAQGVAVDSLGNVYASEFDSHDIKKISPDGHTVTIFAGSSSAGTLDGIGTAAKFNFPAGIVIDSKDNLYVTDNMDHTVRKVAPDGTVTTIAGTAGVSGATDGVGTAAKFNNPNGITIDKNGILYVADASNQSIRKIMPDGTVSTFAGTSGPTNGGAVNGLGKAAQFNNPASVCIDQNGTLFVADTGNNSIRKIR